MKQRTYLVLWGASLLLAGADVSRLMAQADPVKNGNRGAAAKPPVAQKGEQPGGQPTSVPSADQPSAKSDKRSADEEAIQSTGAQFVKAFGAADVDAISEHFTPDAEYIDEHGNIFQGREEIISVFKTGFDKAPGAKLEMNIESIRLITPDVAIEDGMTAVIPAEGKNGTETRYCAIHVKQNNKWLVASVREQASKSRHPHRSQLEQLAWLQGDWVDENDGSVVIFSCSFVDNDNFLLRKFSVHVAGEPAMTGEQRIGWDPLTRKLRTWIFDSEGGHGDGFWFHDDDRWILKSIGVTGDGQTASSTTIYQKIDENTMTWQSVNHEIGGIQFPDSDPVTIVRRSPVPEMKGDNEEAVTSRLKQQ